MRWPPRSLAAFGVVLTGAVFVGCGSSAPQAPAGTAGTTFSPTPSPTAGIDHCIVGSWRAAGGMLPWQHNGVPLTVTGGGGAVTTYNADGSYSADFANAQPYTATTSDGHRLSVTATGATSGTFTASAGEFSLFSAQTTLTVTERIDGAVTSTQHASKTSSGRYNCNSTTQLTLSSGGSTTQQYVRVG